VEVVGALEAGPSLVLAEKFEVDTPGLVVECPADAQQVVHLTWEGGLIKPKYRSANHGIGSLNPVDY
jgi:hypothetical protein